MSSSASRRQRQVADLIQEEISSLVVREMGDPRVEGVTITAVKVSPDLRYADVYFTKMGDEEGRRAALEGLSTAAGYLRRELAPRLDLRYMPELRFHIDTSWEQGARIDELLGRIAAEEGPGEPGDEDQP